MIFFKKYRSIHGFLNRFTIFKIGTLHVRIHNIESEDKTTLFHTHPFDYISIVLSGGYTEKIRGYSFVERGFLSIAYRSHNVFHKIVSVKPNTKTLFISFGKYTWTAVDENNKWYNDCGIYERIVNGKKLYCKKKGGVWYIGNLNVDQAIIEPRASIYQAIEPLELKLKI